MIDQWYIFMGDIDVTPASVRGAYLLGNTDKSLCRLLFTVRSARVEKPYGTFQFHFIRDNIAFGATFDFSEHDDGGFQIADLSCLDDL